MLSKLSHKNIVRFIGAHNDGKFYNLFLELITGGTLEDLYKKTNGLSEPILAVYTKQILQGLEYLHFKNIIHRDIKAANILIEENGQCKLTDFGSSKVLCAEHKTLTGTPYWMAPEVITQTGHNRFADIWSLGCTVYEMFTGRPPWSDQQTGIMVLVKIVNATSPPPYPSDMSPLL